MGLEAHLAKTLPGLYGPASPNDSSRALGIYLSRTLLGPRPPPKCFPYKRRRTHLKLLEDRLRPMRLGILRTGQTLCRAERRPRGTEAGE